MIILLSSRFDTGITKLAKQWSEYGARVMTPDDLSRPGWQDYIDGSSYDKSIAVVGGELVRFKDIHGVLVRIPAIIPQELGHIVPEDRDYVASEMMAYLVSWLSRLKCPLLNKPTPVCLSGPYWRIEKWLQIAKKLGIPARSSHRSSAMGSISNDSIAEMSKLVTVVGDCSFGAEDEPHISKNALRIARAAEVDFLQLNFVGTDFVNVNLLPSLELEKISNAVLQYFIQGTTERKRVIRN